MTPYDGPISEAEYAANDLAEARETIRELLGALQDARREVQLDERHDKKLTPLLRRIDTAIAKARGQAL